jgi:hypothetical protein
LVAELQISSHYTPPDKNKMASRFVPVTDEEIFVLKELNKAVEPSKKKVTNFV